MTAAASRLRVDYLAAEAIRCLEARGVPCILLKGASVTRWLYEPDDAREYGDCDLLVPEAQFATAIEILRSLGFVPDLDEAQMPSWWREHALALLRDTDGAVIDIHRGLPGAHVTSEELWNCLAAHTERMTLGEADTNVLSPAGRALHVALHAAQHGGSQRGLETLARALARLDDGDWRAAAELAEALRAAAAFERGLGLLPAGAALARRLGLLPVPQIEVELRAARAPEALTVARLLGTPGFRARAALVRHKLLPPPTFMRKWSPLARHGMPGLVAAYLWRPLWVLGRTPRAVRAWARARRAGAR